MCTPPKLPCHPLAGEDADDDAAAEQGSDHGGEDGEVSQDDEGYGDGLMAPPDVDVPEEAAAEDDSSSEASSLDICDGEPEGPAEGGAGSHEKTYHLSPERQQLEQAGGGLTNLPPLIGCGVSRHPAGGFWSARFPGHPIRTSSWSTTKSPLKCLVLCLRHILQLYLDTSHPANWQQWQGQLNELKAFL